MSVAAAVPPDDTISVPPARTISPVSTIPDETTQI